MKKPFMILLMLFLAVVPLSAEETETLADKVHLKNILTLRDFVVMVMFPEWDTVVRVDVGNKNLFGAEASKDYPNFVVLFQKVSSMDVKRPLRTNATVILQSGHVFHFLLSSLDHEKAKPEKVPLLYNFTRDYERGNPGVKTLALEKPAPGLTDAEKTILERLGQLEAKFDAVTEARATAQAQEKVLDWMEGDTTAVLRKAVDHGLEVTVHEIRKIDRLTVVRFSVANRTAAPVEILEPQITLETTKGKKGLRARTVSVEKLRLTATRIEPKGTTRGVLAFAAEGARDHNQGFTFSVARKDAADKPVKVMLF